MSKSNKFDKNTRYGFNIDECQKIANFGREAIDTFTVEDQKMDIGSVDDLLNMKGGMLVIAESNSGLNRIRGNAATLEPQRIAESTIESFVMCSSKRSIGSQIRENELNDVIFKIALVEDVIITDKPRKEINLGTDVYYISGENKSWIFPTNPVEYNWSVDEYINRTHSKSGTKEDKNSKSIVLRTKPFGEIEPYGEVEFLDD